MVLEAEAIRRGMEVALQLGYERIVFKTDAKLVLDQLVSMDAPSSPLLGTCRQIQEAKTLFAYASFSWKVVKDQERPKEIVTAVVGGGETRRWRAIDGGG
ncbi:uncharacterized protein G2W53_004234 [Senna tora]|uniref:RNase H type-1 domain-containing protein n=1 Tax=Senna tora TaxID=362788 RepID=A0A835CHT3_9FABA|nr:uncharacterized protein G2W53_004234 [Senna tora]